MSEGKLDRSKLDEEHNYGLEWELLDVILDCSSQEAPGSFQISAGQARDLTVALAQRVRSLLASEFAALRKTLREGGVQT